MKTEGSRAEVMHGTAKRTSGGLTKADLKYNKGRIVSKRKSELAKKQGHLKKAGWTFVKGKFGAVRVEDAKKTRKGHKKAHGTHKRRRHGRKH